MNWSYIAGLFDGEGSVFIETSKPHPRYNYTRTRVIVQIPNTHRGVLERVREFVGYGSVGKGGKRRSAKHADPYVLRISDQILIKDFLNHIHDELIIKHEECDKALLWLSSKLDAMQRYLDVYWKAMAMRAKNASAREISKVLGVPRKTVEGWIYRNKKPRRLHYWSIRYHREVEEHEQIARSLP